MEHTGQLIGGPDNGNFITATVPVFKTEVTFIEYLDGEDSEPAKLTIKGQYRWQESTRTFLWERQ